MADESPAAAAASQDGASSGESPPAPPGASSVSSGASLGAPGASPPAAAAAAAAAGECLTSPDASAPSPPAATAVAPPAAAAAAEGGPTGGPLGGPPEGPPGAPPLQQQVFVRHMQGRRGTQEDRHVIIKDLRDLLPAERKGEVDKWGCGSASLVALFDGHRGCACSDFCVSFLPERLADLLTRQLPQQLQRSSSSSSDNGSGSNSGGGSSKEPADGAAAAAWAAPAAAAEDAAAAAAAAEAGRADKAAAAASPAAAADEAKAPTAAAAAAAADLAMCPLSAASFSSVAPVGPVASACVCPRLQQLLQQQQRLLLLPEGLLLLLPSLYQRVHSAFKQTDRTFINKFKSKAAAAGCTAVLLLTLGRLAAVAWLGDSRAVAGVQQQQQQQQQQRRFAAVRLTEDHKPNRKEEKERIEKAGGHVLTINGVARVAPKDYEERVKRLKHEQCTMGGSSQQPSTLLAVSRSLGDKDLKSEGLVSSTPELVLLLLQQQLRFIVLACDGLWDVLTDQEVVDAVGAQLNDPEAAASDLVKRAFERGSQDNLTAIVVVFN
ncbi:protein phosphatase 2C, putative [Eimeria tenella]|uniref:Protein phosphatase 2C, putative n=1 Tax=Eimeria tenella TaxID=5802 RepID=U6KRE4_EIMTE|nr:protein phosphatase 2C, putative [Eimeria tenella]CDJ39483.1 protein phosphatase 2C, putative [Eimeria tenella]|eukprot:XP_013230238.1 protein phosphatase 2C, putative [Eimeria tenella]